MINYLHCGGEEQAFHKCDPCQEQENGRIRSIAFISDSYIALDEKNNIDKTKIEAEDYWLKGIEQGDILVIPEVLGTYDGGSPKTAPGYGDVKEKTIGKDNIVNINDPAHTDNVDYWIGMEKNAKNYYLAFRTATELRISQSTISSINVKDPIEADVDTVVEWQAEIKWFAKHLVPIFSSKNLKNIFKCFEVVPTQP